ncbi:MAG: UbiA family prenyltransferase [Proteobacteria bacterium]|nr:UbiA family prenyltransferase [Pseudomonadota bacterium]
MTAYWRLARPRGMAWVAAVPLVGFGYAHWERALQVRNGWAMLGVYLAWLFLHVGTMWMNSALDEDEGEVLYGAAVAIPPRLGVAALSALVASVVIAFVAHPLAGATALGCAIMAVLYSHPQTAFKGHSTLGPMVNLLGYGVLSPIAGFVLVEEAPTVRAALALSLVVFWVFGAYFAAQAFQQKEDEDRGYQTYVVVYGPIACLRTARACLNGALFILVLLAVLGWLPRAALFSVPAFWLVDRWMALWEQQPGGGSESWARGMVQRLLLAGMVLLLSLYAHYFWQLVHGLPVAGLGTAVVPPGL